MTLAIEVSALIMYLFVIPDGPEIQLPLTNYTVNESSSLDIQCKTTGNPTPHITWVKKGTTSPLSNKEILSVKNLSKLDAGAYSCKAENILGVTELLVYLLIQCK